MGLSCSVITPATRDDLLDGGARRFAKAANEIKYVLLNAKIEVLVPDFSARRKSILRGVS
ncbi:MAG: hypothetical protein LBT58_03760 [Endomicrobium sp.]|nr:hypothetical protein [Endomicrobium sp.]